MSRPCRSGRARHSQAPGRLARQTFGFEQLRPGQAIRASGPGRDVLALLPLAALIIPAPTYRTLARRATQKYVPWFAGPPPARPNR